MSSLTRDGTEAGQGVACRTDTLVVESADHPDVDHERYEVGHWSDDRVRTYLVVVLTTWVYDRRTRAYEGPYRIGLYASDDGWLSVRAAVDPEARIGGELAHSLLEPIQRLEKPDEAIREHLESTVRETHLPWRTQR